jgi:hypothetical protein
VLALQVKVLVRKVRNKAAGTIGETPPCSPSMLHHLAGGAVVKDMVLLMVVGKSKTTLVFVLVQVTACWSMIESQGGTLM